MINWSYVAPRIALVAALWLLIALGLDPLVRWSLIRGGQSLTSAQVEVERVSTSLYSAQISLAGVRIANPAKPREDLLLAKYARLDLDAGALARRQFVVSEGVIHGLTINAPREDSGDVDSDVSISFDGALADTARDWLEHTAKALGNDLVEDLESVRLARELSQRWPQQYKDLEARADRWLQQIRQLEQLPDLVKQDPLASARHVQKAALTLKSLQAELAQLRSDFQRLHQQARIDKTELADAAARDVETIKQRLKVAQLDGDALTDYLLGPQLGPRVREAVAWMRWVQVNTPSRDLPEPGRGRGVDVLLAADKPQPWLLARSLHVDGQIMHDGRPLPFIAQAQDITTQPRKHGKPAVVRLQLTQPVETWIELTIDRTGPQGIDRIAFTCPRVPQSDLALGDAECLALSTGAGTISIAGQMERAGDKLAGTISVRRVDPGLRLHIGEKLAGNQLPIKAMAASIQHRLDEIHQLDATLLFSGTLNKPRVQLHSPIGSQLHDALQGALVAELQSRRAVLAAQARTALEQEIAGIESKLAMHKQAVMKKLSLADEQQQQLEKLIAQSIGLPKERLGRELLRALERR